ncbi:ergothioneine biosynthesis protein EgtC [Actinomadura madurae]|uniref:ergothioneine biosynthesis protein EgtC n=1 Tax=Actinomadura madurae TaxID=1993 RepID=UPI0020D1FCBA|nr:ergothioneine biosynthesis protein EgtC [Actinomadura madurae]MCP9954216.1 ergothioneine biosynthesis protein EgtC [Actinomadura madurae]MCP9970974.1 ergothioneine biosynthesis protein EgtC [Actinomadura madurae]MCP9983451.1 ergothioneine biosynthesis protein EgtC [Actinomadura madurae]MCQ0004985.1 ergothioneine biosynthesis protein EgtC [Actinomadura madurae]MCQ0019692.1 ergothioneine biosynthesis protein EgtC [Actinomadura madurae]
MCRHLGYLGPERTLHSLVYEGKYSLETQAYAPRMTQGNLLNADGYGVGWYQDEAAPVRFRRAQPIWTDQSFREVAGAVRASCAVAAIRSATVGFPVDESCAQPFRAGPWLFSHNGKIEGYDGVESKLRDLAGDVAGVPDARAPVDSAPLFALAVRNWREGLPLGDGLAAAVSAVTALAPGRYNLLASDGTSLAATTWGDSLFVREGSDAIQIASEPLDDDPGWRPVPDRTLVTAGLAAGVRLDPL